MPIIPERIFFGDFITNDTSIKILTRRYRYYAKLWVGWDRSCLNADIHHVMDDIFEYGIELMPINEWEHRLNAGRFTRFTFDNLPYKVSQIRSHDVFQPHDALTNYVNWIHENTEKGWFMEVIPIHVNQQELIFSFEDDVDAVHFKLRWA